MSTAVRQTGLYAAAVGTYMYLHYKNCRHSLNAEGPAGDNVKLVCTSTKSVGGRASVPKRLAQSGPLVLKLVQVQVIFRHGARTALHLAPKLREANYQPEFIMRQHQATLFPYDRVLYSTKKPVEWSEYEKKLLQNPLKSGVRLGTLTAYGKENMYMLGHRLQKCYRDTLNMATYDPCEIQVLSSNIKRTVESACCVLAGFYGKEQLQAFAEYCFPVKIYVTDKLYDILIPDTLHCNVLAKVNNSIMNNSDNIPGFKKDRLVVEQKINEAREKQMCAVRLAQDKINELFRHPFLSKIITEGDVKALNYLRRLDVEQFRRGYRFNFYFDPNPYFYNDHLCKEVYTKDPGEASNCLTFVGNAMIDDENPSCSSKSIPILWKKCRNLLTDVTSEGEILCQCPEDNCTKTNKVVCKQQKRCRGSNLDCTGMSFFKWYLQPTCSKHDLVGKAIKDEVWADPIELLKNERKHSDPWNISSYFVSVRDDMVARLAHGLYCPKELLQFKNLIELRASQMLHYAMTGQFSVDKTVVTRLSAGPLLTKVVDGLENVIKEIGNNPKMWLFSTHDSTLTGVLEALNIWNDEYPPFGADVRVELYKDMNSSEYYVRLLYLGKVHRMKSQKEDFMHWSEFRNSINKYMIRECEYWDICNSDVLDKHGKNRYPEIISPTNPAGM